MKLYTFEGAPNPRRVDLYLQYKGIELEQVKVNIRNQEQFSEPFKQLNPGCTVPVLEVVDGEVLVDAVSICLYLDSLYPDKPMFGSSALEQAAIVGWDHRIFVEGFTAVAEILRNQNEAFKHRALPGLLDIEQIPELVGRGRERLHDFFARLDKHLSGREFIVGKTISFADIDALVVCDFAGWVQEKIPAEAEYLQSWYRRVSLQLS